VSAGLPGLGLGGLFFIFSALLAPFRELWRTLRGQSRPGDWGIAGRQFAQATLMVAAIDLSLRLAYVALATAGVGDPPSALSDTVIPVTLIGITSALLMVVLVTAKLADISVRLGGSGLPQVPAVLPRPTPLRALGLSGAAAIAWVALLTAGASELSPLVRPPREGPVTERRAEAPSRSAPNLPRSRAPRRIKTSAASDPGVRRGSHVRQPTAEPGHGPAGNGLDAAVQPPTPAASPPAVSPSLASPPSASTPPVQKPTPAAASPNGDHPPASGGRADEQSPAANPPHETGPPATGAPPASPPAHEHTGPPEHAEGSPHAGNLPLGD